MTRPADWWVLDLPGDPTPGDPVRVRTLARSSARMADDAGDAHRTVRGLAGDSAVLSWLGAAGEVFRGALGDFPQMLGRLQDSYEQAGDALRWWAGRLDDLQATADRALAQGRQARAEIEALQAQLTSARAAASSAGAASARLAQVPAGGPPPDPAQLRAAVSSAQAAAGRVGALSGQLQSAQARLQAARSMAEQARELRRSDARTTARRLRDASDAGIPPKSRWQRFQEAAAAAWKATVKVATVVAVVVAVVALFVGGPLVWGILLAASAVLLTDSLHRYGKGEASAWEVGLDLLGVVPGGRLLTAVGKVTGLAGAGARVAGAASRPLAAAGARLRTAATAVRSGADDLVTRVRTRGLVGDTGSVTLGRTADDAFVPPRPGGGPVHYDPARRPGPLADPSVPFVGRQAPTFRSATYTGEVLDEPMVVHRWSGGNAGPDGRFWTPGEPTGPGQAQLGNAINPGWGNTFEQVDVRVIPSGTTVYRGPAAPQQVTSPSGRPVGGTLLGGDEQVYLPDLPPSWGFGG